MAYGNALQSLMGGAQAPAAPAVGGPPPPASLGVGAAPQLPGLPPPPTGAGAMPTGSPGIDKKGAISTAIADLSEVVGHVPNLASQINSLIDQLKAAGQPPPGPGTSIDAPGAASAGSLATAPTMESGSPGPA